MSFVLSVDPGDTTGIALWTEQGKFLWKRRLTHEEWIEWAGNLHRIDTPLSVVVVEGYTHRRGGLNKKGSKLKASQGVGAAKMLAKVHKAVLVEQDSGILVISAMHADVPIVKHFDDDVSAYLHGRYYFEMKGIRLPALQEALKAK